MEWIKREIKNLQDKKYKLEAIGFNSRGVLTLAFEGGFLINLHYEELEKLKKFLGKIQT